MKVAILHLGDAHISSANDGVLRLSKRVVDAARLVESKPDLCVVCLTGDLAFSGLAEQFALARAFVADIRAHLEDAWGKSGCPIKVVVVPGNHDCDFSETSVIRNNLLDDIAKNPALALEPMAIAVCVPPLRAFFDFRDEIAGDGILDPSHRLFWQHRFTVNDQDVCIQCLNTAWLSRRHESAADKIFPEGLIEDLGPEPALVVSLLHHPPHWLQPVNARAVRSRLQHTSNVILTGHEHTFAARNQQDSDGATSLYVEGLALQEHDSEASGFNVVVVDTDLRQFRVVPFRFEGLAFSEQVGPFVEWTPLGAEPLKGTADIQVSAATMAVLRDPGIDLRHPERGSLSLDDIFVFPDMREVEQDPTPKQPKIFNSRKLLGLTAQHPLVLITGARESGKSCLAKRMFVEFLEAGLVPVLLDGANSRLRGDALKDRREIERAFEEQYASDRDQLKALDRNKLVLLFDNYQALSLHVAPQVLAALTHIAGRVVLFSHDLVQHVQELVSLTARKNGAPDVAHFQIMPYGHVRREELIDRYIQLAAVTDHDKAETLRADMRRLLNTALGKYYAPSVPVAIVSILQARAFQEDLDLTKSTYGYYYELLVKRSLLTAAMPGELDVSFGYLTEMARRLFIEERKHWDESWFIRFHDSFNQKMALNLRFSDVNAALVERGMFVGSADRYEFRYGYIYFYFVARALAEDLTSAEGRERVRVLTTNLHDEDAANTLLFLTHLSKDASIIDPMLDQAATVFGEAVEATLSIQENAFPEMEETLRDAVLQDRPIGQSRDAYLAGLDASESLAGPTAMVVPAGAEDAALRAERSNDLVVLESLVARMFSAFRTMQILGQLLKNFPGTLDRDKKMRIARTTYGVGLRVLGAIHELLRQRSDETVRGIVEMIRESHQDMSTEKILDRARRSIGYLVYVAAYGTTQRVAMSVGSPLLQPIFDSINEDSPTPAIQLITAALALDRADAFPEDRVLALAKELSKNPLAMRVLKGLVITHFHLFDDDRAVRQRICSHLDIEFKQLPPQTHGRTRLLSS